MRTNMDPLTPTTSTLAPAIAHIAETAKGLAGALGEGGEKGNGREKTQADEARTTKKAQQDTVRWVLAAPARLQRTLDEGKSHEADRDWKEVQRLLQKWEGVKGVEELETRCLEVMGREGSKDSS